MTKTYPNAPIAEALLDLKISPLKQILNYERFFVEKLSEIYPNKVELKQFQGQIFTSKSGISTSATDQGIIGYQFSNSNNQKVVQLRNNGFSFHRLPPYQDWDEMVAPAKEAWDIYRDLLNPFTVTRIAARYVNVINFSDKLFNLSNYFTSIPNAPEGIPDEVIDFFYKSTYKYPEKQFIAIVTLASNALDGSDSTNITLDIDAFLEKEYEYDSSEIWQVFDDLRLIKNKLFESLITDKTREKFK